MAICWIDWVPAKPSILLAVTISYAVCMVNWNMFFNTVSEGLHPVPLLFSFSFLSLAFSHFLSSFFLSFFFSLSRSLSADVSLPFGSSPAPSVNVYPLNYFYVLPQSFLWCLSLILLLLQSTLRSVLRLHSQPLFAFVFSRQLSQEWNYVCLSSLFFSSFFLFVFLPNATGCFFV